MLILVSDRQKQFLASLTKYIKSIHGIILKMSCQISSVSNFFCGNMSIFHCMTFFNQCGFQYLRQFDVSALIYNYSDLNLLSVSYLILEYWYDLSCHTIISLLVFKIINLSLLVLICADKLFILCKSERIKHVSRKRSSGNTRFNDSWRVADMAPCCKLGVLSFWNFGNDSYNRSYSSLDGQTIKTCIK